MKILIGEVTYECGPRQACMVEAICRLGDIEHHEHGSLSFSYHARDVVVEVRIQRERMQVAVDARGLHRPTTSRRRVA